MEAFRAAEKNVKAFAREIISESKTREEAIAELNKMLNEAFPNYETMSRAERVEALNELKNIIGETDGESPYARHNENRFLAEAVGLSLRVEERALANGFENPTKPTIH